jgi:GT2 family glycosyltransferase
MTLSALDDKPESTKPGGVPPALSVVIPTHNRKGTLLKGLEALRRQSLPWNSFEVVVISDGSTDGTAEALRALSLPYALRLEEQVNQGPAAARNNGFRLAAAPIIVFMDDDIEPSADFLAVHLSAHEQGQDVVLIGPQSGPAGETIPHWIAWEHLMLRRQYDNFVSGVWETGPNNLYSGNFSVRREHLEAAGGFDVRFTRQEDVELGFRLAKRGLKFRFDMRAEGIHRPTRTFESWYRTPYEYGKRDVQIAREIGNATPMELARRHWAERNGATRLLARISIGMPVVLPIVLGAGRLAVRFGGRRIALASCSVLFNLRYLQGMCEALGGRAELWRTIRSAG